MQRLTSAILLLLLLMALVPPMARAMPAGSPPLPPDLEAALRALAPGQMITVIVVLQDQTNLQVIPEATRAARLTGVVIALRQQAEHGQRELRAWLKGQLVRRHVERVVPFWIFNGLSVTATAETVRELARRPEVQRVALETIITAPEAPEVAATAGQHPVASVATAATNAPNLEVINAPDVWALGYQGQGIVVATLDTGVSLDHPELSAHWRGSTNSWFDPYGEHPSAPIDLNGHGTWTMGVLVAGDASGVALGVAPEARWIAAKLFNDAGKATTTAIHQSFQWLLDPDDNPATDDAPHVVNNSWSYDAPGCDLAFQLDLQALRAAGIVPVFAAGNFGPFPSTSVSPANYPEAFAVGATNNSDLIYPESGRGPSACGEEQTTFPDMVAPGVSITTTERWALYTVQSGTSLAAPHVAGALALLLSAHPLNADEQVAALMAGAVDLGELGADNTFGHGRLDALAALEAVTPRCLHYLPQIMREASAP